MDAPKMPTCFVIMPFEQQPDRTSLLKNLYEQIIKPEVLKAGFEAVRADEASPELRFIDQLRLAIKEAALVIADLSGNNPNVMYELGLAHALGKPVILMSNDVNSVPFDLLGSRMLFYKPAQKNELRRNLKKFLSIYAYEKV